MTRQRASARLVLLAYPRSFRTEYGDALLQSISDMRRYGGISRAHLFARVANDVVRTALRMRLELFMTRYKPLAIAGLLTVGIFAAMVGSSMFPVLIASALALLVLLLVRTDEGPIVVNAPPLSHWYRWIIAGAAMFAVGMASAIVDGPDFSSAGWAVWILSWVCAAVLVGFGIALAATKAIRRTT